MVRTISNTNEGANHETYTDLHHADRRHSDGVNKQSEFLAGYAVRNENFVLVSSRITGLGAHGAPARERSGAQGSPRATEPGPGAEPRLIKPRSHTIHWATRSLGHARCERLRPAACLHRRPRRK